MRVKLVGIGCLAVLGSLTASFAVERSIPVDAAQVISREDGEARVLLRAGDLSFLTGQIVKRASLVIPVGARAAARDLDLYVYAAGRDWESGA